MEIKGTMEEFLTEAIMMSIRGELIRGDVGDIPKSFEELIKESVLKTLNRHLPEIRQGGRSMTVHQYVMKGFC